MVKKIKKESLLTFEGISRDFKKKKEKLRSGYMTPEYKKSVEPTLQEAEKKLRGEKRKAFLEAVESKISGIGSRIGERLLGKPLLTKPTVKLPSVDPKKFITRGLGHQALVKEGRTGYFNKEMMEETKWLS